MSDRNERILHKTKYHQEYEVLLEFEKRRKKYWLATLLWLFFGFFGGHRFYLNQYLAGVIILGLTVLSVLLCFLIFYGFLGWETWTWLFFFALILWPIEMFFVTNNTDKTNKIIKNKISTMHELL